MVQYRNGEEILQKKDALKDLYAFLRENQVDIINYNIGWCKLYPKKILKWFFVIRKQKNQMYGARQA